MNVFTVAGAVITLSALVVTPVLAQMPDRGHDRGSNRSQQRQHQTGRPQAGTGNERRDNGRANRMQQQNRHYYNGRWVDANEWQRHNSERDRWTSRYEQRRGTRYGSDGSNSLLAGIVGFALGAAIVGSQQQAQHAQTADNAWDNRCAAKYRSYDRHSRTYLGYDGLRHYCK